MTRAILVRHGQTTANAAGVLAGRSEVELNDAGRRDAQELGETLAGIPLRAAIVSPMLRTRQTAELLLDAREQTVEVEIDEGLAEVEYGEWTGLALADLAKDPLWATVQSHPASVTFPGGSRWRTCRPGPWRVCGGGARDWTAPTTTRTPEAPTCSWCRTAT